MPISNPKSTNKPPHVPLQTRDLDRDLSNVGREYDELVNRGLRLSGEARGFFIRGRLADLMRRLPPNYCPARILDFGCGVGDTARCLAEIFPQSHVVGVDTEERAVAFARNTHGSPRIAFALPRTLSGAEPFDLCYVNGVFHHIPPEERLDVVRMIYEVVSPGGRFALFENNAWSPAARLVMKRIPFDRGAIPLSPLETKRLLKAGGFVSCAPARFLFFFPRPLACLRVTERWLARVPLGAQYYILASKASCATSPDPNLCPAPPSHFDSLNFCML